LGNARDDLELRTLVRARAISSLRHACRAVLDFGVDADAAGSVIGLFNGRRALLHDLILEP